MVFSPEFYLQQRRYCPVQIDYVALATAERDRRMTSVTAKINQLVEAQDDGDITAAELSNSLRYVNTEQSCADWR